MSNESKKQTPTETDITEAGFQNYVQFGIPAERQEALDRIKDRHNARTARRRRVAGSLAVIGSGVALVASNGGPDQIVENARNFPAHVEWVFGDRNESVENSEPQFDVSEPDEQGMVTYTPR